MAKPKLPDTIPLRGMCNRHKPICKCPNCGGPVVKDEHCVSCKNKECGWGICS